MLRKSLYLLSKKELEDILGLFKELDKANTSEVNAMSHPLIYLNLREKMR